MRKASTLLSLALLENCRQGSARLPRQSFRPASNPTGATSLALVHIRASLGHHPEQH
jgi:hypothetical protein